VANDLAGPLYRMLAATPLPAAADSIGLVLLLGALAALLGRYRAGPTLLRQQIKWFVAGAIANVCIGLLVAPFESQPGIVGGAARMIDILATPLPLLGAAAGVVRYRLWEIDVILTRAAAVALVWLALSTMVIGITFASGVVIAGSDPRVLVALVLAFVGSAALPRLRQRIERRLAHRFGTDARGYLVLRRLSDSDPRSHSTDIGRHVVETACAAVGSEWAAAWLLSDADGTPGLRPLSATGLGTRPSVILRSEILDGVARLPGAILWADLPGELSAELDALRPLAPAAVTTFRAGSQPIGLLVIGQRSAEPIEGSDLEVLAALGREVGLLLQNSRLQAELEARLAELDRYAGEIRESRARIVAAQDHERRRIERDLHDGVQQQLVNLAARLRRASLRPRDEQAGLLTDLAGEAETAVFALRELGRGIYPTILTDLGLPAALQAAAARVPMDIDVEIEPTIADRRLGSDIEAALYLVAMEAMTNAQKHAPGADVGVSLGFDEHDRSVLLTVEDHGPGMIAGSLVHRGAGLQNMRDRVAAVGGALTIGSATGGGTRISARVPIAMSEAVVQALDSRGLPARVDGSASRR
jgi:signal transduction histidine kinase